MHAKDHSPLRCVVFHADAISTDQAGSYRLMRDLGHDVYGTTSSDEVLERLSSACTDVLAIDIVGAPERKQFVKSLFSLPMGDQPRHVVVFTDHGDPMLENLRRESAATARMHVFLKPLHLHGLLGVLRNMESPMCA